MGTGAQRARFCLRLRGENVEYIVGVDVAGVDSALGKVVSDELEG